MNIGEKILKCRKEKKLSQEQLAELVGVTRQTISNWELNETTPDMKQLMSLSHIFKISIDELVDNDIRLIMEEKVSNTEKLAGMVIKILKVIGILFLIYCVILIFGILAITVYTKDKKVKVYESVKFTCELNQEDYEITLESDGNFACQNCSEEMKQQVESLFNPSSIKESEEQIQKYFLDKGGFCK